MVVQIVMLTLAGVIWVGVLGTEIRRPHTSRTLRLATFAVLALAVPIAVAAYVFYARG